MSGLVGDDYAPDWAANARKSVYAVQELCLPWAAVILTEWVMTKLCWALAAPTALLLFFCGPGAGAAETNALTVVHPAETNEVFANPGMGWQTFHTFADEDKNLAGLPSASAYFRFYWREIEPRDGAIDFARFDELLAHARRAGQKLAFRIMCTGSGEYADVPTWLKEQGCKGVEFEYGGKRHWVPDFTDPLFTRTHTRLIQELGRRYDGHPDMDLLDIGSVGLWGEWHMSGTEAVETHKPVPLPAPETLHAIIDTWRHAFPKTSKVLLIGSDAGMPRAANDGYGWRADCLGDMGGFSKTWNHMENYYLQQLDKTGATNVWRTAPVAFETCWDMRKWKQEGWDIPAIFDYALRLHASYVNNKSAPIPDGARPHVENLLRKLGYRLVLRTVQHEPAIRAGSSLHVAIDWENIGVAPPYRDYVLALRGTLLDSPQAKPIVVDTGVSIRGWLPSKRHTDFVLAVPESAQTGRFAVAIGIIDAATKAPAVRLANTGRDPEGWYPISTLGITK